MILSLIKLLHFESELNTIPGVLSQTVCFKSPLGHGNVGTDILPNGRGAGGNFSVYMNFVDTNYVKHFGLKIIAGRNFIRTTTDTLVEMIINEEVVKKLGFSNPEDVLEKKYLVGMNNITGEVVVLLRTFITHLCILKLLLLFC